MGLRAANDCFGTAERVKKERKELDKARVDPVKTTEV
jgi:hypothetical protein